MASHVTGAELKSQNTLMGSPLLRRGPSSISFKIQRVRLLSCVYFLLRQPACYCSFIIMPSMSTKSSLPEEFEAPTEWSFCLFPEVTGHSARSASLRLDWNVENAFTLSLFLRVPCIIYFYCTGRQDTERWSCLVRTSLHRVEVWLLVWAACICLLVVKPRIR